MGVTCNAHAYTLTTYYKTKLNVDENEQQCELEVF